MDNSFLNWGSHATPPFADLKVEDAVPAVKACTDKMHRALKRLEDGGEHLRDWQQVEALERVTDPLDVTYGLISHLSNVKNDESVRSAKEEAQSLVVAASAAWNQSPALYEAYKSLQNDATHWATLSSGAKRAISLSVRNAEHSGVGLSGADRQRFVALQEELAQLGSRFTNHLQDSTAATHVSLNDITDVTGVSPTLRAQLASAARAHGHPNATAEEGPWLVGLSAGSVVPFLQQSARRDLRERVYRKYVARASELAHEGPQHDNGPILAEILAKRQELADLLGFDTFAHMSTAKKMAQSPDKVLGMIEELHKACYERAQEEFSELETYARDHGGPDTLAQWDVPFWSEKLRDARFQITEEKLRPYFPVEHALNGVFELVASLFDVRIVPVDNVPVWHPDVRFFRVESMDGTRPLAGFFLDPFERPESKRGGAWMDVCLGRSAQCGNWKVSRASQSGGRSSEPDSDEGPQLQYDTWTDPISGSRLPVAYLVCNASAGGDSGPPTLGFDNLVTFAHELGHGLQHMLTQVDIGAVAGIEGIEWDAVELPSQFMENWCFHPPTLQRLSKHVETGEPLPMEMAERVRDARKFQANMQMLRQLYFSRMDMELHLRSAMESDSLRDESFPCGFDPRAVQRDIAKTCVASLE